MGAMIWFLLALLAGAAVVQASAPAKKEEGGGEGPPNEADVVAPLVSMVPSAPAVDASAPLADQLVARSADFTRAIETFSVNLPIAKAAQATGNRAKVNDSLAMAGTAWAALSNYQVAFVTSLVGAYSGPGAGSIERLLILFQNPSTKDVALAAMKGVFQSRPGYNESDWPILSAFLTGAAGAGVPVYLGVSGESVRGYLYGKETSMTVSPSASVKDFLASYVPQLNSVDPDTAIKAVTGVIPIDSLPIDAGLKTEAKKAIDALSGDLKQMAVAFVLKNFNPDKLIRDYLPIPPEFKLETPVGTIVISTRQLLRVLLGEKLVLGGPGGAYDIALRKAYPSIDADIARVQSAIPQDLKNIIKLYLDLAAMVEASGGSTYACVPRGFCQLVSAFDKLPESQRTHAFTAFGRMKNHFASHAPVITALGLLAFVSENWTLYAPKLSEMLDGSFEKALGEGLKDTARPVRYKQFYTALVVAIATATANDLGVPIYAWKAVIEKAWAGWDGGIQGARDSGYVFPGASAVAFAYYFAEQASTEIKTQLGL